MKRIIYILFFLLGTQAMVDAQNVTNRGTEFWAGFGHHLQFEIKAWFPGDSVKLVFDFSAEQAAHVVVTIDGTSYKEEYDVPANSVRTSKKMPLGPDREAGAIYDPKLYTKSTAWPGGTNSEGIFKNKGIHIVSDVPIVVYERMYFAASSSAAMLLPVDSWGYHYQCLATRQSWVAGDGGVAGAFSYFYVIASQNDTRIRINPSAPNRSGLPANVPFDITLQKGEIYQYLAGESGTKTMHDINGTTITSIPNSSGQCLPFATYIASSATNATCPGVPLNGSLEHILQQAFPQHAWGKRYLLTPTSVDEDPFTHNPNTFRVMVKDPATVVKRNGVVLTGLTNGYYEFLSKTADVIEADQPVQVAQLLPSQGFCGYIGKGDPDYTLLSPVEQAIKQTRFFRNSVYAIDWNYLALTIPTAGLNSLKIDGVLNNYTHSYPHPNYPGYSVVIRRWNVRSNTDQRPPAQCTVESDSAFNAITYGIGQAETYVLNAGTYINNLNGIPFIKNQYNTADTANRYTCVNTPVELSVLLRYKPSKLFWQLSKLAGTILPATDVTDNAPVLVGEEWVNGLRYYRYKLPGTYTFTKQGVHTVPLYASNSTVEQCDHTEQIPYQVDVRGALHTDFDILYENCKTSELIKFNGHDKFYDSSLVKRWEWSFLNGSTAATATGKNVQQLFTVGQHSARLIAVDANACIADTTKQFSLSANPVTPVFTVTPTTVCEGGTITFIETNPEAGVKQWYWDFGNKDTMTLTTGGAPTRTFTKPGTITVKHMVKFSDVCYSDTAVQQVVIYARPDLSIQYPTGCLPVDGNVQFTSQSTAPDGQAITGYSWNFGDAAASAANPNTSTLANPTHKYTNYGSYDITYKVTTEKGCSRDTIIKATFNVRPQFTFGTLSSVCENSSPISIAKAAVTNGVPGTGLYKGKGVNADGTFDPRVVGARSQTIWYVFTTTQGCTDSASQTITVLPKPRADFTATSQICLDGVVAIINQSTMPTGTITNWNWTYGDGTNETRNNATAFSKRYTKEGSYTIQLVTIGSNGCSSDTIQQVVTVNPLPTVAFELPTAVCMPVGKAQFTNKSTISTNSELSYLWSFGDNSSSIEVNPIHNYTRSGLYQVSLKATSAQGCVASLSKTLDKFFTQPVAAFAVSAGELCQGTASQFTDQSTSSNGAVSSWQWAFGDGTTINTSNPSKTYSQPGSYTVHLVVKDGVGCASEPVSKVVQVYLQPVIDAGPSFTVKEGTTIQFKATANSANLQFVWTPGQELSNPNILQPSLLVNNDGVYKLTATGEHNCTASDELKVVVQRPVEAPNVFSPNGDGINDTWQIKNLGLYPNSLLEVFNRYGQKVFSTKGNAKLWDGTMNGKPVPVGTYYYVIQLGNGDPALKGSVTVLR